DLALVEEFHGAVLGQTKRAGPATGPLSCPVPAPRSGGRSGVAGGHRHDRDIGASARLGGELHLAVDQRKERVVLADADVLARAHLGAALADQDVAGQHDLAAVALDAEAPAFGVAAVAGRTACLLVCHGWV